MKLNPALLDEVMQYMDHKKGQGLKELLEQAKMAKASPEMPGMGEKPKGLSIEKVSIMGKKPGMEGMHPHDAKVEEALDEMKKPMDMENKPDGDDMSDDELKELISKYL